VWGCGTSWDSHLYMVAQVHIRVVATPTTLSVALLYMPVEIPRPRHGGRWGGGMVAVWTSLRGVICDVARCVD